MKGQFTIDYIMSLIIFIIFVIYLILQITQIVPAYLYEVTNQRLKSEAFQISEILVNDPGEPIGWSMSQLPDRIGLSNQTQNKTNLMSMNKISDLYTICQSGYDSVKTKLDTENQIAIYVNKTDGTELLKCEPPSPPSNLVKVSIKRIVAIDNPPGTVGILYLEMWG
jgi:hypothetical protein